MKTTHPWLVFFLLLLSNSAVADDRLKIAVFSGPRATVQSSPPLVTSNTARRHYGLEQPGSSGPAVSGYDPLVPQRLAVPVEVLIEMYSAHPLERDAAELYAPPDGYVDAEGRFYLERQNPEDKPVLKVILSPDDGLYALPYMARQADGTAWEGDCVFPGAPPAQCRQPFYPDASRLFEEIDRGLSGRSPDGKANILASRAEFDFFRALPSAGYTKGLPETLRTDAGAGDIAAEILGDDYFVYKPFHLGNNARYHDLAKASNAVQQALDSDRYAGGIWLEASPSIEETLYWLNLITDTTLPLVGVAAQRPHGELSADGPRNIVDAVDFILSRQWADAEGKDRLGVVLVEAESIFASRQVQKTDARPGGYTATGDHGGVIGSIGAPGEPVVYFVPTRQHTWNSAIRLSELPQAVDGVLQRDGKLNRVRIDTRAANGDLVADALPRISIVKMAHYDQNDSTENPEAAVQVMATIKANLQENPLSGFVAEGESPYGNMTREQTRALEIAAFSGMPTVSVGRGNAGGVTATRPYNLFIEGNNLTATKARLLLMASMLKYGSLPIASDPRNPTAEEKRAVQSKVSRYQSVFDMH